MNGKSLSVTLHWTKHLIHPARSFNSKRANSRRRDGQMSCVSLLSSGFDSALCSSEKTCFKMSCTVCCVRMLSILLMGMNLALSLALDSQ